ncbi:hypothetical protein JOM56_010276 [Amanita muscaria]
MPTKPVVRASPVSSGRFAGLIVDSLEDTTTPSSPAPSVITVSTGETFSTPLEYTVRCVKDVFNQKAPDFHRAQALYTVFTEIASELETTSHFNAVMTRIAENLESLGCKKQPCTLHCDRSHCEPCTLEHATPCTLPHAEPCTLTHAQPCTLPHFFVTPEPCVLPHAEPCKILHIDPCTLSHAEPCTLAHNEPCQLTHTECTLNHFPLEPVTIAIPIPCPIAHNELCTKEHVPTRPSTPIPSLISPDKHPLIDSSSTKQLKRKRFKSSTKRKPIKTEDTCAILATQYGSEPEMDSDGFFPNPTYGLREAFDDFMKEDPNDNSLVMDREILQFDREYPFADQSYKTPQVISLPTSAMWLFS